MNPCLLLFLCAGPSHLVFMLLVRLSLVLSQAIRTLYNAHFLAEVDKIFYLFLYSAFSVLLSCQVFLLHASLTCFRT
jgi:hypothetical protein